MFFERLKELCTKNGTTPTAVTIKLGYDRSNVTYWKSGKIPNGDIVIKIADYFNVSTDYLLCKTDNSAPPGKGIQSETEQNPLINKILKVLPNPTNEEFEKLIDYARYIDSSRDE